jgi:hypothetical protein
MTNIRYLFEPQSIAVTAASHDTAKIGFKVLENIILGGHSRVSDTVYLSISMQFHWHSISTVDCLS